MMSTPNAADTTDSGRWELRRFHWPRRAFAFLAIASTLAAVSCFLSYQSDCARLREIAKVVVEEAHFPADRVIALLHWVYGNQSTTENRRCFLFPRFRATPCQVLETGGDCADKSRLLSAMLREIGIPAGMAMCFDPRSGNPTHTIVVATIAPGTTMVVDPVYDLFFPKPQPGQYYGLVDLRSDATILANRLDQLRAERPRSHPIHSYNREAAGYSQTSCMNWNRNSLTRAVGTWLAQGNSHAIHAIPRPLVIEEPKLLAGGSALFVAAFATAAFRMVGWLTQRRCRRSGARLPQTLNERPACVALGTYPCGR